MQPCGSGARLFVINQSISGPANGSGRITNGTKQMAYKILILGASYGSLLGTKLLMAGHNVTLVCRAETAQLINAEGTEVRIKLKGEETHRAIRSADLPGKLDAKTPEEVDPAAYDLVGLAMQLHFLQEWESVSCAGQIING